MPVVPMPAGTPTPPPVGVAPSASPSGGIANGSANPFLAAALPPGEAGQAPRSLLPPPPTPPPGLGRTLPPIPKFAPPPQKPTSTAPPTAIGTTLPPVAAAGNLMGEIAMRTFQRRGKNIGIAAAALVALIVGIKVIGSSSSAATEATGIRASSRQGGIKLLVDGKLIGTLPQEVKGMTPGEHAIVFDAGERYAPQRRTVELVPGEVKELEPVTLKVTKGSAIFDVKTPGTQLALVSSDERRELTDYSHPIDVDNTKSWTLEATKRGYRPIALPVTFDERAERTFTVQLSESGGVDILALPAANVSITEEPTAAPIAAAEKTPKAKKRRDRGESAPRFAAPASVAAAPGAAMGGAGTCSLNINTIPSSHITLDGRNLGNTPRLGVMVASGSHNIVFSTDNARKSTITSCRPGETKTVAIRMPE
jgi:hypothetical protein